RTKFTVVKLERREKSVDNSNQEKLLLVTERCEKSVDNSNQEKLLLVYSVNICIPTKFILIRTKFVIVKLGRREKSVDNSNQEKLLLVT
ncbi:9285_t:CDS:2, partial [Gigaspora margarita]